MKIVVPRLRTTCTAFLLSDFCALLVSLAVAYCFRALTGGHLPLEDYFVLVSAAPVFLMLYAVLGLYPGILRPPSEELKRLSLGSSIGFLFLSFILFLGQQGAAYSRGVMIAAWLLALVLVPLARALVRRRCASKPWWGYPVLLFSPSRESAEALRKFFAHRDHGLFIADVAPLGYDGTLFPDAPERADALLKALAAEHPGAFACIVADAIPHESLHGLVQRLNRHFRRIVVRLDTPWLKQSSLRAADFPCGPVLAMRQNLLDPARLRLKRLLDICFCLLGGAFFLFLIPLIALAIRLDSKGPIFFRQRRIGRNGKPFYMLKFRSMIPNAPALHESGFANGTGLHAEWSKNLKLANDPRLTRVGTFLRRTSLDELPQIINVIKGEMSIVGPRPMMEEEIERYGDTYDLYTRVRPGLTGLWQISGRSDLSYDRRLELVHYYIYNWSIWLDIYIITRTPPAMLSGKGAY